MTYREKLKLRIAELKNELERTTIEEHKLCDETQWYTEEFFSIGRNQKKHLLGIIHWIENLKDEDTGEVIPIERSSIVMRDGVLLEL